MSSKVKSTLQYFDLFNTPQFLRYKGETQYSTVSGGICTIVVIVVFMALFFNMGILTVNKDIINWDKKLSSQFTPSQVQIQTSVDSKFMFMVGLFGINLNAGQRLFDIQMVQRNYQNLALVNETVTEMVQCTQQHFSINENIKNAYTSLNGSNMLCPPLGFKFNLKGKFTSSEASILHLDIKKCVDTNSSRSCANQTTIDGLENTLKNFMANVMIVNPMINPGSKEYIDYYLEDRNFVLFTRTNSYLSNLYVQQYSIQTDQSLIPVESEDEEEGFVITDLAKSVSQNPVNDVYTSFWIIKSSQSFQYQRQFNKIDEFFSYVGGLIGIMFAFMFFIGNYSEMAFQVSLARRISTYKKQKIDQSFHIFHFLGTIFHSFVSCCGGGKTKKWRKSKIYQKCSEQITNQIDIGLLIRRIIFLQKAISLLFTKQQLHGLYLQRKDTLKELKSKRQLYQVRQKMKNPDQQEEEEENQDESQISKYNQGTHTEQNIHKNKSLERNQQIIQQEKIEKEKTVNEQFMDSLKKLQNSGGTINKQIVDKIDEDILKQINTTSFENIHKEDQQYEKQNNEKQNIEKNGSNNELHEK